MALRTPCLRLELDWRISRAVHHSTHVEVAVDVEQIHDFRVAELTRASRHCCGTERSMTCTWRAKSGLDFGSERVVIACYKDSVL
jgi:hypothetical protein